MQRVIATTIATVANPLGVAIGFLLPTIFITPDDIQPTNKEKARTDIFWSLVCQAILGTIVALLVVLFFKDKPPTPPSASAGAIKEPFMPSIRALFQNKVVILLMLIFGFIQGVFNTLGTVVGEIANKYGLTVRSSIPHNKSIGRCICIRGSIYHWRYHWICWFWSVGRDKEDLQAVSYYHQWSIGSINNRYRFSFHQWSKLAGIPFLFPSGRFNDPNYGSRF